VRGEGGAHIEKQALAAAERSRTVLGMKHDFASVF